jgi:hypothetical protein
MIAYNQGRWNYSSFLSFCYLNTLEELQNKEMKKDKTMNLRGLKVWIKPQIKNHTDWQTYVHYTRLCRYIRAIFWVMYAIHTSHTHTSLNVTFRRQCVRKQLPYFRIGTCTDTPWNCSETDFNGVTSQCGLVCFPTVAGKTLTVILLAATARHAPPVECSDLHSSCSTSNRI